MQLLPEVSPLPIRHAGRVFVRVRLQRTLAQLVAENLPGVAADLGQRGFIGDAYLESKSGKAVAYAYILPSGAFRVVWC